MRYCVDASSFIRAKNVYPMEVYVGFWDKLSVAAKSKLVVAPREVQLELARIADEINEWAKEHDDMFLEHTGITEIKIKEVIAKLPKPRTHRHHGNQNQGGNS